MIAPLGAVMFGVSAVLTGVVRRVALSSGLVDVPNSRSSHTQSTARGGGLAVVITTAAGFLALRAAGFLPTDLFLGLTIGGCAMALIGFLDDVYSVRPSVRLLVHFLVALGALHTLGGLPTMLLGERLVHLQTAGYVIGALGIVWVVNLFNFMDGIDGIAASETIFICVVGTLLTPVMAGSALAGSAAFVVAAACGGFLLWNWPPARIFLGDVGSGYLGYLIAGLAVAAGRDNPVALWIWLILGGAFLVDATVTLVRRSLRGERFHEAHRSHAYQHLARRWGSHRRVTLTFLTINLVWLLPWSVLALEFPRYAIVSVFAALGPLALVAVLVGSGRREHGAEGQ